MFMMDPELEHISCLCIDFLMITHCKLQERLDSNALL